MEALDAIHLAERLKWEGQEYWVHLDAKGPLEKYPAKQHARRVQEKLGVERGLVYLPAQRARNNEDSDMPSPFRQRRYFYYLSGCNEPDCHLTYDIQNDNLALFIPRIDPKRVIWNGRGSTPAEALDKYDVDEVYWIDELQSFIRDWSRYNKRSTVYILHPSQNAGLRGPFDSESLQPAMNLARVIKDEHEIKLIRRANDISSAAHTEILANILKFKNEAQVEGLFLNVCISKQAKEQAYAPIAASGPNAGTLHYDANNEDFEDRQLMCLDAGCEWELYASDITRTFPLSGDWPSEEAKNIYQLVQRMQEACIAKLAPGVRYLDLHILAHHIAIEGLLSLGILHNGTREEIYNAGTSRCFFPHGLGHHVGLEVHDVGQGDLMSLTQGFALHNKAPSLYPENFHLPVYDSKTCMSPTDPESGHLEEGMVVTVEPGIYFSTYALSHFYLPSPVHSKYINFDVVHRYLPVGGVRIEDDILITSKGHENLTSAPKGEAMLDIIRSGNSQWPFDTDSANIRAMQSSSVERKSSVAEGGPLLRAPGISRHTPEPILRPIRRATTVPMERPRDRKSVDFEPFSGPSLYSNFKRTATPNETRCGARDPFTERLQQKAYLSSVDVKPRIPVCGEPSNNLTHAYMDFQYTEDRTSVPGRSPSGKLPDCKKCTLLIQTLGRLRQNLTQVEGPPVADSKTHVDPQGMKTSKLEQSRQGFKSLAYNNLQLCNASTEPTHSKLAVLSKAGSSSKLSGQPAQQRPSEGSGSLERELVDRAKNLTISNESDTFTRKDATLQSWNHNYSVPECKPHQAQTSSRLRHTQSLYQQPVSRVEGATPHDLVATDAREKHKARKQQFPEISSTAPTTPASLPELPWNERADIGPKSEGSSKRRSVTDAHTLDPFWSMGPPAHPIYGPRHLLDRRTTVYDGMQIGSLPPPEIRNNDSSPQARGQSPYDSAVTSPPSSLDRPHHRALNKSHISKSNLSKID